MFGHVLLWTYLKRYSWGHEFYSIFIVTESSLKKGLELSLPFASVLFILLHVSETSLGGLLTAELRVAAVTVQH